MPVNITRQFQCNLCGYAEQVTEEMSWKWYLICDVPGLNSRTNSCIDEDSMVLCPQCVDGDGGIKRSRIIGITKTIIQKNIEVIYH
jgi:hypothetical protein